MASKKYVVANPVGLAEGTRLISWESVDADGIITLHEWYEGDVFVPPAGLNITRLVEQGKIIEEG